MVREILSGEKWQTRRVVKEFPAYGHIQILNTGAVEWSPDGGFDHGVIDARSRFGSAGDRLWVKETFCTGIGVLDQKRWVEYRADENPASELFQRWSPSIFMPRDLSRITLDVLDVRIERLQEITESDAYAEGCWALGDCECTAKRQYQQLWNRINLKPSPLYETDGDDGKKRVVSYVSYPWSEEDFDLQFPGVRAKGVYRGKPLQVIANPFVWVIEFRKVVAL